MAAVGQPAAMPGLFQQGQCDVMYTNTQTVATLKGKGVDEKRLTSQGYGETQPLVREHAAIDRT